MNHAKPSLQQKITRLSYALFFLGLLMTGLGFYVFHNNIVVMIGIMIIALSVLLAIIADPSILPF